MMTREEFTILAEKSKNYLEERCKGHEEERYTWLYKEFVIFYDKILGSDLCEEDLSRCFSALGCLYDIRQRELNEPQRCKVPVTDSRDELVQEIKNAIYDIDQFSFKSTVTSYFMECVILRFKTGNLKEKVEEIESLRRSHQDRTIESDQDITIRQDKPSKDELRKVEYEEGTEDGNENIRLLESVIGEQPEFNVLLRRPWLHLVY